MWKPLPRLPNASASAAAINITDYRHDGALRVRQINIAGLGHVGAAVRRASVLRAAGRRSPRWRCASSTSWVFAPASAAARA